ncbi:histone-lysine N-methyltransferase H3 lysine-9 specific SUVH1 [Tripterygium wilfordii]|uniref:Histone-lysine N-methyltransferase H3 lysine-9 specific SUVH1 n=1 Tax=Tripterygium wilfordii TaxID=458696 RepID=A0A7J7CU40_TRIWF|nr:histone-lysine N-methyltransferase, H3 lysine-9 specific SUVH1-like [Tripterygium wilfordii]XP_038720421.1 histone-lysine N-methyltransferase, H3 lysine-9 specific SUVH1-like [Tripterygium wilfordii]XP_038720422.1 histone-lysine N-methyltransferase, H3 lysine-9 specific SUVH1-like [Tripterygium wilfordii]XP_038720423.1 histone-lysine N-methyltransferase, H3 lysine-9 specific SUVH1-like [Tripterygium wilfordii]KAF5737600.1 histone-lysine N-methyltransferase H3 lysine-9 specific SUVH1 [Tripter
MEQFQGRDSTPRAGSIDKSRVLEIKPLRCLVPIFPSQPNFTSFNTPQGAAPFVCSSPSGPFPPGATSFFPFFGAPGSQGTSGHNPQTTPGQTPPFPFNTPVSDAVPITSFRASSPPRAGATSYHHSRAANGDTTSSGRVTRRSAKSQLQDGVAGEAGNGNAEGERTRFRKKGSMDPEVDDILTSFNIIEFNSARQNDGDKDSVEYVLLIFDLLRRKIAQIEDSKVSSPGVIKRPDLRAGTFLMTKNIRTNATKRMGSVPGVEVGDIFFFRFELCLVGLHSPSMAGIDYLRVNLQEEPVAVSVVSSGGYEDDVEDGNVLIYSGQGGNLNIDQKLERGNLALKNGLDRGNEVRVIRGVKDLASLGKVYVYDGLYKVEESWVEKGRSGCNVFKFKLIRLRGQPEAFTTWKLIQQWKDGISSRIGVILPDLTSGAESLPVSLVNEVDNEKGPEYFTYFSTIKYSKEANSADSSSGCACAGGCLPGNLNCYCIQKNGGYLPYVANGVVANAGQLIYECGPSCLCPPNCKNRVSQGGLKVRFEVFKTKDKGWGLRSWDPIRGGAYICEYAGEAIDNSKVEALHSDMDDYLFDATRSCPPILPSDSNEAPKLPFPLAISAKNIGNVARFMNHSCSPNVIWQPVLRTNNRESDLHVAFHAVRHIPPMTELTYDYGMVPPEEMGRQKKLCLCGSSKCRGFFH